MAVEVFFRLTKSQMFPLIRRATEVLYSKSGACLPFPQLSPCLFPFHSIPCQDLLTLNSLCWGLQALSWWAKTELRSYGIERSSPCSAPIHIFLPHNSMWRYHYHFTVWKSLDIVAAFYSGGSDGHRDWSTDVGYIQTELTGDGSSSGCKQVLLEGQKFTLRIG